MCERAAPHRSTCVLDPPFPCPLSPRRTNEATFVAFGRRTVGAGKAAVPWKVEAATELRAMGFDAALVETALCAPGVEGDLQQAVNFCLRCAPE